MRGRVGSAVTVLVVLSVIVGGAVAGHGSLHVVDRHTTDADFNAATTLTGMTVEGSGESASLELGFDLTMQFSDGFEDNDLSEYTGSTDFDTQSTFPRSGTYGMNDTSDGWSGIYNSSVSVSESVKTASVWTYEPGSSGSTKRGGIYLANDSGAGYAAILFTDNSGTNVNIRHITGTTGSGTLLKQKGVSTLSKGWYQVNLRQENSRITAWVEDTSGNTVIGPFNASDTSENSTTAGIYSYHAGTAFDDLSFESGSRATGTYVSKNFTTAEPHYTGGFVNFSYDNASVDITWEQDDDRDGNWETIYFDGENSYPRGGGNWTVNWTQSISTGSGTFTSDFSYENVRVNITFQDLPGPTTAKVYEEGMLIDPDAPRINDSTAAPTGPLSTKPGSLSVDIGDQDFPEDTVEVDFTLDGSSIGSDTLTSNGTASTSISQSLTGGNHSWTVTATDEHGHTQTSSYSFRVPDQIKVYNESDRAELLDNVSTELRFYVKTTDPDTIVSRTTDNGTLNMTGLPADQPFIVVANAPGFLKRRIFVPSLYRTQKIYLLNESSQYTEVLFQVQDYSGNYPEDKSVLQVQRGINDSWQTVMGDYFGASGEFTAQLRYNVRHRLVITNIDTGDEKVLGTITPLQSGTKQVVIEPETGEISESLLPTVSTMPATGRVPGRENIVINSSLDARDTTLSSWNVTYYYVNDSANVTLFQTNSTNSSGGVASATLNLSNKSGGRVKAVVRWQGDDRTGSEVRTFHVARSYADSYTFFGALAGLMALLPGAGREATATMFALGVTVIGTATVAATFKMPTELIAVVALMFVAGFASIGWLGYDVLFTTMAAAAAIAYLRRGY